MNLEFWEAKLESEWLSDIDSLEWFSTYSSNLLYSEFNNSPESFLKLKFWLEIRVNTDWQEVLLFSSEWNLVWYIRPGIYTYWNVSSDEHLETWLLEEYRSKLIWQALYDIYLSRSFSLPKYEVSHKKSAIKFLLRNWYKLYWYYDDSWNLVEFSQIDILNFQNEIFDCDWEDFLTFSMSLKLSDI